MKRPQIIGLTGPKGAGKTTVAELLCRHAKFSGLAFGDLLRAQICTAFCVDLDLFTRRDLKDTPTKALALERNLAAEFNGVMLNHLCQSGAELLKSMSYPRTPREIMKFWAEQYRKPLYGENYFTRCVVSKVYLEQSQHQWRHVIHDVRFDNEAKAIRSMGGVIWQIKNPNCTADPSDPTETDGSEFLPDLVINNAHSIRHLQDVVIGHWVMAETGLHWSHLSSMGSALEAAAERRMQTA